MVQLVRFANNVKTTLASPLTPTATQINVAAGSGAAMPILSSPGDTFILTLADAATQSIYEIVIVTARNGDALTVVRGQEGTQGVSWSTGDFAMIDVTAGGLNAFTQPIQLQKQAGNYATDTSANANAVVIAFAPAAISLTNLTGAPIRFLKKGTNTGPVSIAINGLAATALTHGNGQALEAAALFDGVIYEAYFNGTGFYIASPNDQTVFNLNVEVGALQQQVAALFGSFLRATLITASQNWGFPQFAQIALLFVVSGGGGGGGNTANYGGGGGGAGVTAISTRFASAGNLAINIPPAANGGAPGLGGADAGNTVVSQGGQTAIVAEGGHGGAPGNPNGPPYGGAPGEAVQGGMAIQGGYGTDGQSYPQGGGGVLSMGGTGGASLLGGGGRGSNGGGTPSNGTAYGSGGGGSYGNNPAYGGTGASGAVLILC